MSTGRQILIADPDPDTARQLAPSLRQRGHAVTAVKNGSRALEFCVLRAPDLVLFDVACTLLDSHTFRQILRANPRTERVPVLTTGKTADRAEVSLRDGFLLKPFNVDEVLARIDQIFRRAEVAQRARRSDQGMEGTLGQLSLVDLVQVLGQSRKSGELRLTGPRGSAIVRLAEGAVISAQAEQTRGVKAFFRLLSWRDGNFSFVPGEPDQAEPRDIQKSVEELLLEGMRQADELASMREQIPDLGTRLVLRDRADAVATAQLTEDNPVVAEILELARGGATVGEILERARATDFLAARALASLLQHGLVAPAPGDLSARAPPRPLLPAGAAHALRVSLMHGRSDGTRPRGKLLLCGPDPVRLNDFVERMSGIAGCSVAPEEVASVASKGALGSVGRLDVSDDLALDLVQLPVGEAYRPAWLPFSSRAVGGLMVIDPDLPPEQLPRGMLDFLARELGVPVVLAGPSELPAGLAELDPQVTATAAGPLEAVRLLLLRASQRTRSLLS